MASFLEKLKIKTATNERSKRDLSCCHVTSGDFMQFGIAYARELVPKESISVGVETFTRMEPLVVPTFGRANIKNRAFFVPFRTVFPGWNDFITQSPHIPANATSTSSSSVLSSTPLLHQFDFWQWFLTSYLGGARPPIVDPSAEYYLYANPVAKSSPSLTIDTFIKDNPNGYDYVITFADDSIDFLSDLPNYSSWSSGHAYPVRLSSRGRQIMKILNSLGYVFSSRISPQSVSSSSDNWKLSASFSALPLLCAAKIYADWFMPNGYDTTELDYLFKHDILSTESASSTLSLSPGHLEKIFDLIVRVSYDADYFVSAWDNPNAPNNSQLSGNYVINDINNPVSSSSSNGRVTYPTSETSASYSAPRLNSTGGLISKFALDSLVSLSDYIKRHQLVGARSIDRFLARFGVQLSSDKMSRSIYLGEDVVPLQIGDVMSTADTADASGSSGMPLGGYAGKGIAYGSKRFEHDTDEYGMFFIISTIVPAVGYYQGFDRHCLHTSPLSFWTPEFDSLGSQAISRGEVFEPVAAQGFYPTSGTIPYFDMVFGYTPRYAEYKVGRDRLTGDKRYNSLAVGQDSWHLMRVMNFGRHTDVVHSRDFVRGFINDNYNSLGDVTQYDRIFQNIDGNIDHFNLIYQFNVTSYAPMSSLFDNYEWKDHDKGETVHVDVNGVKMN